MLAEELIVDNIPPLSLSDTCELALNWMDDYKVSHLCVVQNKQYLGTVSESDILGLTDIGESLSKHREIFDPIYVKENQHIFEVVKVVNDHHLTIIPVLDANEDYIGAITVAQLMKIIADMPVANNPGGIIVLELNQNDYSLAHISSIIEENDTKILGTFITSHPDSTKVQLTIKVNSIDISAIIASLQRHEYTITFYNQTSDEGADLKDRFDSFMNYLNI